MTYHFRIKDESKTFSGVFDAGERGDCHLFTGDACWLFIALFYGSFRDILLADELCVHE